MRTSRGGIGLEAGEGVRAEEEAEEDIRLEVGAEAGVEIDGVKVGVKVEVEVNAKYTLCPTPQAACTASNAHGTNSGRSHAGTHRLHAPETFVGVLHLVLPPIGFGVGVLFGFQI